MKIRNRIKTLEYIHTRDLTAHPGNWREHPKAQTDALMGVLKEVGIAGALLAYRSERQGGALVVIDGHLRKDAAPQTWPVLVLDVDDVEADYLLATHDPLAAMATADVGALDALLSSVQSGEAAVTAMLASLAESAGIYPPKDDADAEPQIDRAEELRVKWGVETGQIWRLSSRTEGQEHRLICGDCTDKAVVARVMGGEKADMVFTDPPYGVAYRDTGAGAWNAEKLAKIKAGMLKPRFEKIENDDLNEEELYLFLVSYLSAQSFILDGKAPQYICHASRRAHVFRQALVDTGYAPRAEIIWAKSRPVFNFANYKQKHEPIYYAAPIDGSVNWYGDNSQTTLWEVASENGEDYRHPTQKPVPLAKKAIENSSRTGDLVYEPFSGSGTTIIAAENLSRQCRAVEISPAYCAVALQRYSNAFGITPELID